MKQKKILFISSLYPSSERPYYCIFLEQQIHALQQLGYQVEVLVPQIVSTSTVASIKTIQFHSVAVHYMSLYIPVLNHYLKTKIKFSKLPSFQWQEYDIVHLHFCPLEVGFTILDICHKYNLKIIQHIHGLNVWKDYGRSYPISTYVMHKYTCWRKKVFLQHMDAIIGVSHLTNKIVQKKIKTVPLHTVYNGVDLELFTPKKSEQSTHAFQVLCVGNLLPIKGQRFLIEAVANLINKGKEIHLILVGNGADLPSLKQQVKNLRIDACVQFAGACPYDKVAGLMQVADAFVLPSYFEALGCVYLEAMACSIPVCGCQNNVISEIITHKENGILLKEQDVQSIEENLLYLMENRDEARKIGYKGYQCVQQLSWQESALKLKKIYDKFRN